MSEREKHLDLVVAAARDCHAEWADDREIRFITEPLEQAFDELVEVAAHGDVPASRRDLVRRIEEFGEQWESYKSEVGGSGDGAPLPGNTFWRAFDAVCATGKRAVAPAAKPLEPIQQLLEDKVSRNQICLMYGFMLPDKSPDKQTLTEEIAEPGKHTGPGTGWMPPHQRRQVEAEEKALKTAQRLQQQRAGKLESASKPAAESLQSMLDQDLSLRQIAKMRKEPMKKAAAAIEAAGLEVPPKDYDDVRTHRGEFEPELTESAARGAEASQTAIAGRQTGDTEPTTEATDESPPAMSPEKLVVGLHLKGLTNKEIVAEASKAGHKMGVTAVGKLIERYKKEPEAFGEISQVVHGLGR